MSDQSPHNLWKVILIHLYITVFLFSIVNKLGKKPLT